MKFLSLDTNITTLCEAVPDHTSYTFKIYVLYDFSVTIQCETDRQIVIELSIHIDIVFNFDTLSERDRVREDFDDL